MSDFQTKQIVEGDYSKEEMRKFAKKIEEKNLLNDSKKSQKELLESIDNYLISWVISKDNLLSDEEKQFEANNKVNQAIKDANLKQINSPIFKSSLSTAIS